MRRPGHVLSDPERVDKSWLLRCSCGWHSASFSRADLARSSGAMHVTEVLTEQPATGPPSEGLQAR